MTAKSNRWGKIPSGPPWWSSEGDIGILAVLHTSELKVWMYCRARCGSLDSGTIITVDEICRATGCSYASVFHASKLLRRLGLFHVEKKRNDAGHVFNVWSANEPEAWNVIEVNVLIAERHAKAEKRSTEQRKRFGVDVQERNPPSNGSMAADVEGFDAGQRRTNIKAVVEGTSIPSSNDSTCMEEVEEERREDYPASPETDGKYQELLAYCRTHYIYEIKDMQTLGLLEVKDKYPELDDEEVKAMVNRIWEEIHAGA